ncbi:hypothetical protein [Neobacillus jeddahensis]|uniref:hypothetical protein n=1 Tax=Neobacillus jeddahensis TaxID=1461580 RepID=UPI00058C3B30|nr:hypothetical protein [Neobacillus jeddahensis]
MKIHEYYRVTANMSLNGSIAALVPTIMIIVGNLTFIKNKEVMLLTIPFLIYSIISFQLYLFRMRQSIAIGRNMVGFEATDRSIFEVQNLLVLCMNSLSPRVLIYFPDGYLAGTIKKFRGNGSKKLKSSNTYALYNLDNNVIGFFERKAGRVLKVEVYDFNRKYLGCFEKTKLGWRKTKKELLDSSRRYVGAVEGSSVFMDEQVYDSGEQLVGRLRRGWMPLQWAQLFPESNTPVLSFAEALSDEDKLLRMSVLINEYFIER